MAVSEKKLANWSCTLKGDFSQKEQSDLFAPDLSTMLNPKVSTR